LSARDEVVHLRRSKVPGAREFCLLKEKSAVIIIKNEGFAALVLDASIGDAVHCSTWRLGGGHGALPLLASRLVEPPCKGDFASRLF
jgi:hypothetical protein